MIVLSLLLAAFAAPAQGEPCPPETIEAERTYSGVFLDDFEGAQFFDGATGLADVDRRARPQTWMDYNVVDEGAAFGIASRAPYIAYRVRFIGVKRSRGTTRMPCGYGHMNAFDADMRVVRLLAIEKLGPSVTQPSR